MLPKILLFFFFLTTRLAPSSPVEGADFSYNGFNHAANMTLTGMAEITSDGLLRLTNGSVQQIGRAFYSPPLRFKNSSNDLFSFSTTFVFAILSKGGTLSGHGIAFVISPSKDLPGALPSQYLGLFNLTNDGNSSNHVVAIELDTIQSTEFGDIDNNHVGIDINSLRSSDSSPASYFTDENRTFKNISLSSGEPMQVWIEYSSAEKLLTVTISPITVPKPKWPLLSYAVDLSSFLLNEMFVGFSSSTGSLQTFHYISGWSFKVAGSAQSLHLSTLPRPPQPDSQNRTRWKFLAIGLPLAIIFSLSSISIVVYMVKRKIKFAEILEDWELEYGPHRFFYKDLFTATKGFDDKELLGVGGFGKVYRGILPTSKTEVAVKKISHGSRQGMREFVAEIASIGRIRHPNLVRLLGYCRRKGELLLVYDFMPNGSLDKLIFGQPKTVLDWSQRLRIIKGVASGLFYLHEDWAQVVLHRDIKASNVLLDGEMNGTLGDFGLARLYDHGTDPHTTHMVGTYGYIAPELARTGKATTCTDVFAFGIFMLEVACGKRPLPPRPADEPILVDWVLECWNRGEITAAVDPNLRDDYVVVEMELVLKLGLLCSHSLAAARPTMWQVVKYLEGVDVMPVLSPACFNCPVSKSGRGEVSDDTTIMSFNSVGTESILNSGR